MSDDSEQDQVPKPRNAEALGAMVIDEGADAAATSARSKPPPKPRLPSARPDARKSPLPPRPGDPPRRSSPIPPAKSASDSIRPMPMIKLGGDTPRSQAPPSSVERLSIPPSPPSRVPPPIAPGAPPPRTRAPAPSAPELDVSVEVHEPEAAARTSSEPEISVEAKTVPDLAAEHTLNFDVTTDDEPEPETPRSIPAPPKEAASEKVASQPRSNPPERTSIRSQPPLPPSTRAAIEAAPEIEAEHAAMVDSSSPHIEIQMPHDGAEELEDADIGPGSDEEPPLGEGADTLSIAVDVAPQESPEEAAQRRPSLEESTTTSRKPPPPPKRKSASSPPSERAVAQALQPPKFEPPTAKPRARPWWEELFTDDFARGILPPTAAHVRREVDFIEDSLAVAKGGVVMDLGCGGGAHAVELSSRGYGLVGFDLSLPQLALAGELAQERGQKINFLQGDMRDMSFVDVFDGIYCWNTSFGYFEEERNVAVAERVFNALRPGGRFLLDVINRDFVVEQQPSQVWFEGDSCVCMDDMSVDFITSRLRVKRTMMLDDGRTKECTFSIRIYSLHELGKLLHGIGFRVTEASGHPAYPGVFFGATSPRVVILAQKP
ncbi:MAG TPA: methyltransferase domain-containing protein [Polyangiaceae bacterium]|nr:methyltransferase domain-containing protein [Polyangiaceae bacterium]